jgi:hypothetical protein
MIQEDQEEFRILPNLPKKEERDNSPQPAQGSQTAAHVQTLPQSELKFRIKHDYRFKNTIMWKWKKKPLYLTDFSSTWVKTTMKQAC